MQLRRVAWSSLLGTILEYDFLLYSTMAALVFGRLFFPSSNSAASTLAAFGTLAAGYAARPLGGVLFGHFGDRLGRKSMLIVTMVLMGGASFVIGRLPGYDAIGVLAPVLLVALRLVQGIVIGGEWGGAALMVIEHSDADRRGKCSGIMQFGSPIGCLLSTDVVMMVSLLPDESLYSWGWRLPFLLSGIPVVVGLYVRMGVVESPAFQEAAEKLDAEPDTTTPLAQLMRPRSGAQPKHEAATSHSNRPRRTRSPARGRVSGPRRPAPNPAHRIPIRLSDNRIHPRPRCRPHRQPDSRSLRSTTASPTPSTNPNNYGTQRRGRGTSK
uniref:MFS transporter n=1 Tax=Rhodococcus wratislaviensis TaxID=44752 RepID=UPI003F7D4266